MNFKNRAKEPQNLFYSDLQHVKTPVNQAQFVPETHNSHHYDSTYTQQELKKIDRLPAFTLNYLQLMDQCTENIAIKQQKQNHSLTNPFMIGNAEHLKGYGAVFKETKLPKYKNFPFMSRRHMMIQSQMNRSNASQEGQTNEINMIDSSGLKTPQITVNRLSAIQKISDSRSNSNQNTSSRGKSPYYSKQTRAFSVVKTNLDMENIEGVQQSGDQNILSKTFHPKITSPKMLQGPQTPIHAMTTQGHRRAGTSHKAGAPLTFYFQNQHFKQQLINQKHSVVGGAGDKRLDSSGMRQVSKSQLNSYANNEKMIIVAGINLKKGGQINIHQSRPSAGNSNPNGNQQSAIMQGWTQSRGKEGVVSPGELLAPQNPAGFGAGHQLSGTKLDIQQYTQRNDQNQNSFRQEHHQKGNKNSSLGLIDEKQQSSSSITHGQQLTARNVSNTFNMNNKSLADVTYVPIPLNQIKIVTHNVISKQITVVGNSATNFSGQNSGSQQLVPSLNVSNQGPANQRKIIATMSGVANNNAGVMIKDGSQQFNPRNHHLSYSSANEDEDVISLMQSMMIHQGQHFQLQPLQQPIQIDTDRQVKKIKGSNGHSPSPPPPLNLQSMTKEEIEQLVPWRYQSKDYFIKPLPPMSPSSLAPKQQALSTDINKIHIDKKTQLQRMMLRDNPQFLDSLNDFMLNNSTIKASIKLPETPLKTVAEVLGAKRDKTPLPSLRENNYSNLMTQQKKDLMSEARKGTRPSRLKNYHIDAIEEGKQGYKRKKSPVKTQVVGSPISNDIKNLNNVFGIPLKTHWVFRGNPEQFLTAPLSSNQNRDSPTNNTKGGQQVKEDASEVNRQSTQIQINESPRPLKVKNIPSSGFFKEGSQTPQNQILPWKFPKDVNQIE